MSKNLLGSARKIRARLQPALVKELRTGDRNSYRKRVADKSLTNNANITSERLLFLDQTLEGMIKRFEDEFPETRLPSSVTSPPLPDMGLASPAESLELNGGAESHISDTEPALADAIASDDEEGLRPVLSRHNSDVSLASRALSQEEGRMHRFGQQFRRDMVNPDIEHGPAGTPGSQDQPMHMKLLRAMVEGTSGEEIKNRILNEGEESIIRELSNEASELRQVLKEQDPEGWVKFVESQEAAMRNQRLASMERNVSAIE
jgi:hypothetical protein